MASSFSLWRGELYFGDFKEERETCEDWCKEKEN